MEGGVRTHLRCNLARQLTEYFWKTSLTCGVKQLTYRTRTCIGAWRVCTTLPRITRCLLLVIYVEDAELLDAAL